MASRVNMLQQSDLAALQHVLTASSNGNYPRHMWSKEQAITSEITEKSKALIHKELEQEILSRLDALKDNQDYSAAPSYLTNGIWWNYEADKQLHSNQNGSVMRTEKDSASTSHEMTNFLHSFQALQPFGNEMNGNTNYLHANISTLGMNASDGNTHSRFDSNSTYSLNNNNQISFVAFENHLASSVLPTKCSGTYSISSFTSNPHASRDSESENASVEHSYSEYTAAQLLARARNIVKALTYDVEQTGHSSPKDAVVDILKTAMLLLGSCGACQAEQSEKNCVKGVGGPNFSAPTMLAHPDEFKNPSSFLKIYGDPLCGQSPSVGGASPVKNQGGNWVCRNCSNINFPRRFRCNKCNEFRDSNGDEIVSEYAKLVYWHHLRSYRAITSKPAGETPLRRFNGSNQWVLPRISPKRVNSSRNINSFISDNSLLINDYDLNSVNI